MLQQIGKTIIVVGIVLIIIGVIFSVVHKIPYLGKLPGDIYIKKNSFTFYFPLTTSIILSILLTILLNLFFRKK